jgi:hypothetical protein
LPFSNLGKRWFCFRWCANNNCIEILPTPPKAKCACAKTSLNMTPWPAPVLCWYSGESARFTWKRYVVQIPEAEKFSFSFLFSVIIFILVFSQFFRLWLNIPSLFLSDKYGALFYAPHLGLGEDKRFKKVFR